MKKNSCFNKNLLALSRGNTELYSRLLKTEVKRERYKFPRSRSGEAIPAMMDAGGTARPLHSVIDPRKEAKRLIDTEAREGFLILLGLGGGFFAEASLERNDIKMVIVIEHNLEGFAELLLSRDYSGLFNDPRFRVFVDLSEEELKREILNLYQPVIFGGINVIPLRPRIAFDTVYFSGAKSAVEAAIDSVASDYSVQAHFGKRWFSNIVKNVFHAGEYREAIALVKRAAVTAAGPSLSLQIPVIEKRRKEFFLIAADTSLPCLLQAGIKPDAVISIDCQHISYYHFMNGLPEDIPLFLDLASPPLLASLSKKPFFFSGGHPLAKYISRAYRTLPEIDTSGGNVCYAAVSLAEQLGCRETELYGADFSYPLGISYAKGTYIHSYFSKYQNRFSPLEAQSSAFLFRTPLDKKKQPPPSDQSWYYETRSLKFYREKLEEKSRCTEMQIIPAKGLGAPIKTGRAKTFDRSFKTLAFGDTALGPEEFLENYKNKIVKLKIPGGNTASYLESLESKDRAILTTMLPLAAAIKKRDAQNDFRALLEETKIHCLGLIDAVLANNNARQNVKR